MSAFNNPGKLESAMKSVVDGLSLTLYGDETAIGVNTGQDDSELPLPSVTLAVIGSSGQEFIKGTGILQSKAVVRVTSSSTITLAQHQARAAAVFDGFFNDTIAATLAAAVADFHVYDVKFEAPDIARRDPRDDNAFVWVSELMLEVVWCGSDIA